MASNPYLAIAEAELNDRLNGPTLLPEPTSLTSDKTSLLANRKEEKVSRLGKLAQGADLQNNTYSEIGNGLLESNANKVWNDLSGAQLQDAFSDAADKSLRQDPVTGKVYSNVTGEEFTGDTRRMYMYGTKDDPNVVKVGLARGDLPSSDYRYTPGQAEAEGYNTGKNGYGWDAGENGVDLKKNYMDMLLPYETATALEGMVHGNKTALENRQFPDVMAPEALAHASGVSEYYNDVSGILGDTRGMTPEELTQAENNILAEKELLPGAESWSSKHGQSGGSSFADFKPDPGMQLPEAMASGYANLSSRGAELVGSLVELAGEGVEKLDEWQNGYNKENPASEESNVSESALKSIGSFLKEEGAQIQTEQQDWREKGKYDELVGYDTSSVQGFGKELADMVEKGDYLEAVGHMFDTRSITAFTQSLPEMVVMANPFGLGGVVSANIASNLNELEDSAAKAGIELSDEDKITSAALSTVGTLLDRFGDKVTLGSAKGLSTMMKGMPEGVQNKVIGMFGDRLTAVGVEIASIAPKAAVEGITETAQTVLENKATDASKMNTELTDKEQREALEAGMIGMAAGGVPSAATATKAAISNFTGMSVEQLKAEMDRRKQTRNSTRPQVGTDIPAVAPTMDDIANIDVEIGNDGIEGTLASVMELQNRVEDFEDSDELSPEVKAEYAKRKETLTLAFDDMSNDEPIKFGSTADAESFLLTVLKGKTLDDVIEPKLESFAKINNISSESLTKIKNLITVEQEAIGGKRGAASYLAEAKVYMKDPEKNSKKIQKLGTRMGSFYDKEVEYKSAVDSVIDELGTILKTREAGVKATQTSIKRILPISNNRKKEHKIEFKVNSLEDIQQSLVNAKKISDATGRVLTNLEDGMVTIGKETTKANVTLDGFDGGITVPAATKPKNQKFRDNDQKLYSEHDVSKVILDTNHGYKWNEYKKVASNSKLVNTKKYTSEDVVVVNSSTPAKSRNIKGYVHKLDKATINEIVKAKKAGATIVMDSQLDNKAKVAIRTAITIGHTYSAADADSKVYKPKEKAIVEKAEIDAVKAKAADKAKAKSKANGNLTLSIAALINDISEIDDISTKAKKDTSFKEAATNAKEYYSATDTEDVRQDKMIKASTSAIKKQVQELSNGYRKAMVDNDSELTSMDIADVNKKWLVGKDYSTVAKKIEELAVKKATDDISNVNAKVNMLSKWKGILATAKDKGGISETDAINALLTSKEYGHITEAKKVVENILKKTGISLKRYRDSITDKKIGMTLTLDINEIVELKGTPTVFNTLPVDNMGSKLYEIFNNAKKVFTAPNVDVVQGNTKKDPSIKTKEEHKKAGGFATLFDYSLYNDPARMLLMEEVNDKTVLNDNVVAAMTTAVIEQIAINGRMISDKYKTKEDVARMHGIEAYSIGNREAIDLGKHGMLKKTLADDMGKAIAKHLGIKRKANSEVADTEQYDRLIADLGQYAILLGVDMKVFDMDEMSVEEYMHLLGRDGALDDSAENITGTTVGFVKIPGDIYDDVIEEYKESFEVLKEQLPDVSTIRREPSDVEIGKGTKEARKNTISKDISGFKPAEEAKTTLENLMNQEYSVNFELVNQVLDNQDDIKALLGWIDMENTDALEALSYESREIQPAINMDIERSIEELSLLKDKYTDNEDVGLFFEWFYTKNGRYMMDSNTINPQTDKQLHRFIVTPKEHKVMYGVSYKEDVPQFTVTDWVGQSNTELKAKADVDPKVVQQNMYYALAQGLGIATDKKESSKFYTQMQRLLEGTANSKLEIIYEGPKDIQIIEDAKIADIRNIFMKKGELRINVKDNTNPDNYIKIEVEHFTHALQAFSILEKIENNDTSITSSITAEFDAVTSGFAIKLAQMPVIGRTLRYALKVGIIPKVLINADDAKMSAMFNGFTGGESWADFKKDHKELLDYLDTKPKVSMNDILDGKIRDSYQTAAEQMVDIDSKLIESSLSSKELQQAYPDFVNYAGVLADMRKGHGTEGKSTWDILYGMLPKHIAGTAVKSDLRTLFKNPFMIFNYSASIKSIRISLANKLATDILEKVLANKEKTVIEELFKSLNMNIGTGKLQVDGKKITTVDELRKAIQEVPADRIMLGNSKKHNLHTLLSTLINASYGSKLETVLTKEFKPFLDIQAVINNSFKGMFEVFNIEYTKALEDKRAANDGILTVQGKLEVLMAMQDAFPAIKGPFTKDDMKALIPIYKTKSGTPDKSVGAKTWLSKGWAKKNLGESQETLNIWHKIKEFDAAISAGSVVPIHFIDGALMGRTLNHMTSEYKSAMTTSIHDAVMPPLLLANEVTRQYNKEFIDMSDEYSVIDEIVAGLERVLKNKSNDEAYNATNSYNVNGKWETLSVSDFVKQALKDAKAQQKKIIKGRKQFKEILDEDGAYVMHMAGMSEGVFEHPGKPKLKSSKLQEQVDKGNIPFEAAKEFEDSIGKCNGL